MPLAAGSRFGSFEVMEVLGRGGMGEVYRARDLRLERAVALKVLPDHLVQDPDTLARFEREARVLASLQHPSVAAIFGLEWQEGHPALVLELVEGITLAERLARGPCTAEEAIALVRQVLDALEAAHARGIVHRDLKPANIKLTREGTVKVLDFGLAAILAPEMPTPASEAPTIAGNRTLPGVVLGTPGYMAPEQAAGQAADRRADLWAVGVLLWELLTGGRLFQRESLLQMQAAVLQADVDWSALPTSTPPSLRRLLRRTLQPDPRLRLRDAADARLELDDALGELRAGVAAPTAERGSWRLAAGWAALGVMLGLALGILLPDGERGDGAPALPVRSEVPLVAGVQLDGWGSPVIALSPDGRRMAYVGIRPGEQPRLYLHDLAQGTTRVVPDSETAEGPFFSPDGEAIGFAVGTSTTGGVSPQLKRFTVTSGLTQKLCDLLDYFGGTWAPDGSVYFVDEALNGIARVHGSGGKPERLIRRFKTEGQDQRAKDVLWPQMLPDGRHLLVVDRTARDGPRPAILDLGTRELRHLEIGADFARYVPPGRLLLVGRDQTLSTVDFDPATGRTRGEPVARIPRVSTSGNEASAVAVSDSGMLAYATGYLRHSFRELFQPVRAAAGGASQPLRIPAAEFLRTFRLSPDGRQALAGTWDGSLWVFDVARGTSRRLHRSSSTDFAVWSQDGRWVAFTDFAEGMYRVQVAPVDGTVPAKRIFQTANEVHTSAFTGDGKHVLVEAWLDEGQLPAVWALPVEVTGPPRRLVSDAMWPAVSPDGRWIAYLVTDGRILVPHVMRADGTGPGIPVANLTAREPCWARDGRELYFRQGDDVVAVAFTGTEEPRIGEPRRILRLTDVRGYDTAPGSRTFVGLQRASGTGIVTRIQLVTHWTSTLQPPTR